MLHGGTRKRPDTTREHPGHRQIKNVNQRC